MKNPGINRCRNPHTLYALFLLCAAKLGIISRAGKPVTLKKPFSVRPRSAEPPRHTPLKPVKTSKKRVAANFGHQSCRRSAMFSYLCSTQQQKRMQQ